MAQIRLVAGPVGQHRWLPSPHEPGAKCRNEPTLVPVPNFQCQKELQYHESCQKYIFGPDQILNAIVHPVRKIFIRVRGGVRIFSPV